MKGMFWLFVTFLGYTYLGYPLWLFLRSLWRPRPVRPAQIFPFVSVVMAVFNEEEALPRKLANLVRLNYPGHRLEVIVVSDGSTDRTNEILESWTRSRVRAVILPQKVGKAAAINRAVEAARGEIVAFTDARQIIDTNALEYLVSNFSDTSVGCVTGELILTKPGPDGVEGGVEVYWNFEKKIRQWEAASASVVGATGAFYAARKELLSPLPAGLILDDLYSPFTVIRNGKRVVFEPRARVWDSVARSGQEFQRKVRTLTGNYQLVRLAPWLLTQANPIRFEFVCHKLFRLFVPFALLALFISPFFIEGLLYRIVLILQLGFYVLAGLSIFRLKPAFVSRIVAIPHAFLLLNAAAFVAFFYFIAGKKEVWVR